MPSFRRETTPSRTRHTLPWLWTALLLAGLPFLCRPTAPGPESAAPAPAQAPQPRARPGALVRAPHQPTPRTHPKSSAQAAQATTAALNFGRLPLTFEENRGQTDPAVRYLARGEGYALFLKSDEATFNLRPTHPLGHAGRERAAAGRPRNSPQGQVLKMRLLGADPAARVVGAEESGTLSHYLKGRDPARWVTGVHHARRVRCENVYPGTDLEYYGRDGALEYDFRLQPGAVHAAIRLRFEGLAGPLSLDPEGRLLLPLQDGHLIQQPPICYQPLPGGGRQEVAGSYAIRSANEVGFRLAAYDTSATLVIDPIIEYATYLGGGSFENGRGVAVDSSGSAFLVGETESTDFPATSGALQRTFGGDIDLFVAKLNPAGNALEYATYLGGSRDEETEATLALGPGGTVAVAGDTSSSDFPTTSGAYLTTPIPQGEQPFLSILNASGSALLYSTFTDPGFYISDLAFDSAGKICLFGEAGFGGPLATSGAFQSSCQPSPSLFKSLDGAAGWAAAENGLPTSLTISSLALEPGTPSTLYAATFSGIYKSTDGAATWADASNGLQNNFALALAIDPQTPATLYVGTGSGVEKSTDGGASWNSSSSGLPGSNVYDLVIDPSEPATLYAATQSGVYKSTDSGANWTDSSSGIGEEEVQALLVHPSNSNILYAGTNGRGVFKSINGGQSWSQKSSGLGSAEISDLAQDPADPEILYAIVDAGGVFKSVNGATAWSAINNGLVSESDNRQILIDPTNTDLLYLACDLGVFLSANGGSSWILANSGMASDSARCLALDPTAPATLYCGTDPGPDLFFARFAPNGSGSADLTYATYLGGTGADRSGGLAIDSSDHIFLSGFTRSTDFPTTSGAFQTAHAGTADAFLVKLNPAGGGANDLVYGTYFGGASEEQALRGLAVDANGYVFFGGFTGSSNLPATTGAFQTSLQGGFDAFAVKLSPSGGGNADLIACSYFGGGGSDAALDLALTPSGAVVLAGLTESADLPTLEPFQETLKGAGDAFVAVLKGDLSGLAAGSYLGGTGQEVADGVAVDANGFAYLVGVTTSKDFPKTHPFQTALEGQEDAFLAKIALTDPNKRPLAVLGANAEEGMAPLAVTFDGSLSSDPTGGTLTTYQWDFGDGTTTTTAVPTVSYTYTTPDAYTASLVVRNDAALTSDPAHIGIVAGDGQTGDGDLFTDKALFGVNFGLHNQDIDADSLKLSGSLNPAGLPADLSGVLFELQINDVVVGPATSAAGARNRARAAPRAGAFNFLPLLSSTGKFSLTVKNADLRQALGVQNQTGTQSLRAEIRATISGVTIDTPTVRGVVETDFVTREDSTSKSAFSFLKLGTRTGAFKSTKTSATEGTTTGSYLVKGLGPIVGEFNTPVAPTGDLTLTIGDAGAATAEVITVPLASFQVSGSGATSVYTYSKSLGEVPQILKFQINNAKKRFILQTTELANTGIPASASGTTTALLPLAIEAPTAGGPLTLTTTIELKRAGGSKSWTR